MTFKLQFKEVHFTFAIVKEKMEVLASKKTEILLRGKMIQLEENQPTQIKL